MGGDSDFMPVSQKMTAAGRALIGVGTRKATNRHWVKSCHDFRSYENLVEVRAAEATPVVAVGQLVSDVAPADQPGSSIAQQNAPESGWFAATEASPAPPDAHLDLIRRALRLIDEKRRDSRVNKAEILPMAKRLNPTFDSAEHGDTTFSRMHKDLDVLVGLRKGEYDQKVRLR